MPPYDYIVSPWLPAFRCKYVQETYWDGCCCISKELCMFHFEIFLRKKWYNLWESWKVGVQGGGGIKMEEAGSHWDKNHGRCGGRARRICCKLGHDINYKFWLAKRLAVRGSIGHISFSRFPWKGSCSQRLVKVISLLLRLYCIQQNSAHSTLKFSWELFIQSNTYYVEEKNLHSTMNRASSFWPLIHLRGYLGDIGVRFDVVR